MNDIEELNEETSKEIDSSPALQLIIIHIKELEKQVKILKERLDGV